MGLKEDVLRALQKQGFWGPFWDYEALTAKAKWTRTKPLELENVLLAVKKNDGTGIAVGLDITETVAILPVGAKAEEESARACLRPLSARSYPSLPGGDAGLVYFRGEFTVTREDQLTQECLNYILNKLSGPLKLTGPALMRLLFTEKGVARHEDLPLVIVIQGYKKVPIVPLLNRDDATVNFRLDLTSVDSQRHFTIKSLNASTLELSLVFLARHHAKSTIMNIVELNPSVPIWDRTPKWFAARYRELYRNFEASRWGRILGIQDRGPRLPGAPEPGELVIGTPTNRPRWLRPIGERETLSTFGSHVEWIILQFHCQYNHVIDMPSWLEFAESTFRARRADPSVARRDEHEGQVSATQRWEVDVRKLIKCRHKTYPASGDPAEDEPMDENRGRDVPSSSSSSSSSSDSDSEPDGRRDDIFADDDFGDDYVPPPPDNGTRAGPQRTNERGGSSRLTPDRRRELQERLGYPVIRFDQLDMLSRRIVVKPFLDKRLQWHCPGCNECFDVMNLTEAQRQMYNGNIYYERNGRFIVRDEQRGEALRRIWKVHGARHLKERGVSLDATHPSNQSRHGTVRRLPRPATPEGDDEQQPGPAYNEQADVDMEDAEPVNAVTGRFSTTLTLSTQRSVTLPSDDLGFRQEQEQGQGQEHPEEPSEPSDHEEANPFAQEPLLWRCPLIPCAHSFPQEALLTAHFNLHHPNETPIKCSFPGCKAYARMLRELPRHMKQHENEDPNAVPLRSSRPGPSNKRARPKPRPSRLGPPSSSSGGERTFPCPLRKCSSIYKFSWERDQHLERDHPKVFTYECMHRVGNSTQKCRAMFLKSDEYKAHVAQDHRGQVD